MDLDGRPFAELWEAARAGDAEAQLRLVDAYRRQGREVRAERWLRTAAAAGHPEALYRLALTTPRAGREAALERAAAAGSGAADLELAAARLGAGDLESAVARVRRSAGRGEPAAWRILGALRGLAGDAEGAARDLALAAAHGDALAAALHGLRCIEGRGRPPDPAAGAAWLRRSALPVAGRCLRALAPAPASASPQEFGMREPGAMRNPAPLPAAQLAAALDAPATSVRTLDPSLPLDVLDDLLDAEARTYLMAVAEPFLEPSRTVHPVTGASVEDPVRTSHSMSFGHPAALRAADVVVQAMLRRLAAAAGYPPEHAEPLALLRYRSGEAYRRHRDHLGGGAARNPRLRWSLERSGDRALTLFVSLQGGVRGGATDFPELRQRVEVRAGRGVRFRNLRPDGTPEPRSLHAGLPVEAGEKWLVTLWFRERPFVPPPA